MTDDEDAGPPAGDLARPEIDPAAEAALHAHYLTGGHDGARRRAAMARSLDYGDTPAVDYQVWLVVPRDLQGKPRGVEKAASGQMFYTEAEADQRRDRMNANMLSASWITVPALVRIEAPS